MPFIDLDTLAGPGAFHYNISSPTHAAAKTITPDIPTVVLIHPVYAPSTLFHPVFADPRLRRFNLVTLDLRGHGTTSAKVEDTYGRETAARDVLNLMKALDLPPCHVMGVSMGACIALQMAILAPERVLSLFMLSPLPLTEPAETAEGRTEIYDFWIQGYQDPKGVDDTALTDALTGALQLAYNNQETNLSKAITSHSFPQIMERWAPGKFDEFHTVTVKFFVNRHPHAVSTLERVRCPVVLVHCGADIAYPIEYSQELLDLLRRAGLDAKIAVVEGAPHFGNVTHPKEVNALLYNFVLSNSSGLDIPAARPSVESPFLADLIKFGLEDDGEDGDYE
ncbi:Alpha/Beta hydrolase protein [Mycena latifolia]|nr:Alpha/Beta hydrolase protein [Mycena latifolia]